MQIARKKEGGLNGQRTFEEARKPENVRDNSYWTDTEIRVIEEEKSNDTSCCIKLRSYFQSHLTYNPGVQIDFRGRSVKQNPLRTSFAMQPNSAIISFADVATNTVEFEFVNDGKINAIDRDSQWLIIQVVDNETERNSQDRVIAESLLLFNGLKKTKRSYCSIPIYDSVEGELCGHVVMSAMFEKGTDSDLQPNEEWIGSKLSIEVLGIIDLKDPNAQMVKNDNNIKRDVLLLFLWLLYMIGSIIFHIFVEDFTFIDALYLRIVTAFTVGYGDMFPVTDLGKVLNVLFILVDTMSIGFVISKFITYILEFKENVCFLCCFADAFVMFCNFALSAKGKERKCETQKKYCAENGTRKG